MTYCVSVSWPLSSRCTAAIWSRISSRNRSSEFAIDVLFFPLPPLWIVFLFPPCIRSRLLPVAIKECVFFSVMRVRVHAYVHTRVHWYMRARTLVRARGCTLERARAYIYWKYFHNPPKRFWPWRNLDQSIKSSWLNPPFSVVYFRILTNEAHSWSDFRFFCALENDWWKKKKKNGKSFYISRTSLSKRNKRVFFPWLLFVPNAIYKDSETGQTEKRIPIVARSMGEGDKTRFSRARRKV